MEKSISEQDAVQTFRSPPRRRRSTFFERRDFLVPLSENVDPNINKNATDFKEHTQELERYYCKLVAEEEQWKKEVQSRRNKYHDLRQQYAIAAKAPGRSRICYSSLLDEDIEFLKGKISIAKLVDSQRKLHESVIRTHALYKRVMELNDVVLRDSEEKVKKITEHILDYSTVDT